MSHSHAKSPQLKQCLARQIASITARFFGDLNKRCNDVVIAMVDHRRGKYFRKSSGIAVLNGVSQHRWQTAGSVAYQGMASDRHLIPAPDQLAMPRRATSLQQRRRALLNRAIRGIESCTNIRQLIDLAVRASVRKVLSGCATRTRSPQGEVPSTPSAATHQKL